MRADTHDGPEQMLHLEAEYIVAALTFVDLKRHLAPRGRAIHYGTFLPCGRRSCWSGSWGRAAERQTKGVDRRLLGADRPLAMVDRVMQVTPRLDKLALADCFVGQL